MGSYTHKNNDIKNINIASKLLNEANNHYQNNILLIVLLIYQL